MQVKKGAMKKNKARGVKQTRFYRELTGRAF